MSIKSILSIFFIGLGCIANATAKNKTPALFQEHLIESSIALTHPVIVADLLPQLGKEIATLGVDEQGNRWLHIYEFDLQKESYQVASALKVAKNIARFDISDYSAGYQQSLYFLDKNSVFRFEPTTNSLEKIVDVKSIFLRDDPEYISRGDFVIDLNNDGLDELLLAGFEWLNLIRLSGGEATIQKLDSSAVAILDDNGIKFKPRPYFVQDADGDQRKDILIAAQGKLRGFYQQDNGTIANMAVDIPLAKDISAIEWWHKRNAAGEGLDQADLIYRRLSQLRDINNDGVVDMVVKATQSSGVLERVNDYQVFMGSLHSGELTFEPTPLSVISAQGTLSGFELVDINNDSVLEVILSGFDIGLSQIIGALLSGGIDQDVYLFSMGENGRFAKKPSVSKEVELSFSLSSGQTGSPVVKLADINGDKLKDLVLSDGTKKLKVYMASNNKRRFARRALKYRTQLPQNGSAITVDDLNNDGKDDLVMKYGRLDDAGLARSIRLLIAN